MGVLDKFLDIMKLSDDDEYDENDFFDDDEYDDEYVERETEYTEAVGSYIKANIDEFLTIR